MQVSLKQRFAVVLTLAVVLVAMVTVRLALKAWLQQKEATVVQIKVIYPAERFVFGINVKQLVQDLERAYEQYLSSAELLLGALGPPADPARQFKQFTAVQKNFRQVSNL